MAQNEHSVVHATFELERTYDAPVARVWRALTDPEAKARWFSGDRWKQQGAFLYGYDDAGSREHGTAHLLDRLGAALMT